MWPQHLLYVTSDHNEFFLLTYAASKSRVFDTLKIIIYHLVFVACMLMCEVKDCSSPTEMETASNNQIKSFGSFLHTNTRQI